MKPYGMGMLTNEQDEMRLPRKQPEDTRRISRSCRLQIAFRSLVSSSSFSYHPDHNHWPTDRNNFGIGCKYSNGLLKRDFERFLLNWMWHLSGGHSVNSKVVGAAWISTDRTECNTCFLVGIHWVITQSKKHTRRIWAKKWRMFRNPFLSINYRVSSHQYFFPFRLHSIPLECPMCRGLFVPSAWFMCGMISGHNNNGHLWWDTDREERNMVKTFLNLVFGPFQGLQLNPFSYLLQ